MDDSTQISILIINVSVQSDAVRFVSVTVTVPSVSVKFTASVCSFFPMTVKSTRAWTNKNIVSLTLRDIAGLLSQKDKKQPYYTVKTAN